MGDGPDDPILTPDAAASRRAAASPEPTGGGRRLWRMRKLHQSVDAELWPGDLAAVELRYTYNGALSYRRTWPSRDEAVREAMVKRAELERDGWMFHW